MSKKQKASEKKEQGTKKGKVEDFRVEVSQTRSDVKSFIKKFKSDVARKKRAYKSFAQRLHKKKS